MVATPWCVGIDNSTMRINLVTPFAEKDAVKALGLAGMLPKSVGTSLMWQT